MQIQIRRILCPLDFSENSEHALKYAAAFASAYDAELILLHVVEPPVYAIPSYPVVSEFSAETLKEVKEYSEQHMHKMRDLYAANVRLVREEITAGLPFLEIINMAKGTGSDLIVLGTHGRTGLAHMLIGSVAEKVVRKAPCPVLTVKHPQHEFVMPENTDTGV